MEEMFKFLQGPCIFASRMQLCSYPHHRIELTPRMLPGRLSHLRPSTLNPLYLRCPSRHMPSRATAPIQHMPLAWLPCKPQVPQHTISLARPPRSLLVPVRRMCKTCLQVLAHPTRCLLRQGLLRQPHPCMTIRQPAISQLQRISRQSSLSPFPPLQS